MLPWLSPTDQHPIMVKMKFLEEPIVPVPGTCKIMYLNRIIDSHLVPLDPGAENGQQAGRQLRWFHRLRTFHRENHQTLRVSVDLSDPCGVRSPSPWSSEFDLADWSAASFPVPSRFQCCSLLSQCLEIPPLCQMSSPSPVFRFSQHPVPLVVALPFSNDSSVATSGVDHSDNSGRR